MLAGRRSTSSINRVSIKTIVAPSFRQMIQTTPPPAPFVYLWIRSMGQINTAPNTGFHDTGTTDVSKDTGTVKADGSFETEFVDTHNAYRRKHGAPPLTLSRDLCRFAQSWADHLLSIKTLKHSQTDIGENLYYAWSSTPNKLTGMEAVDSWYSEVNDYNFSKPGFNSKTGHFTQVVWKSSEEIGVGVATDGKAVYVVGQYSPAGNISNEDYFEKNVLPTGR